MSLARVTVQVSDAEIARIEALRDPMWEDPKMRAGGRMTTSRIAREALILGLAALEARYGVGELAPEHYPEFAEQEYA